MEPIRSGLIGELNARSREVFRALVDAYLESGEPVGSRTISRRLTRPVSPATVRNVMADLQDMGLLYSPHTSAGRLPTEIGLRLFVEGLLEVGDLSEAERANIDGQCAAAGRSMPELLEEATTALSGLARCAGLVVAPKTDRALKHIEFVHLGETEALAVLVTEDGLVENRVIQVPKGTPPSSLIQAGNYLNARLAGRTLDEARAEAIAEIDAHRAQLDALTREVVEAGLATWAGDNSGGTLIVRGQAHLLEDVSALSDLEHIRTLFEALEARDLLVRLLELTAKAEGVQIFIGAENALFSMAGASMVLAPYSGSDGTVLGAVGVIGPTRINYARIVPIVDYTAQVVGRLLR